MEQTKEHKERNKGGRPKKEATEKLKYRIAVKMTAADYFRLLTRSHEAGVSPSMPDTSANSAAWLTISTSLRVRQTPEASTMNGGTARWQWQGFMNL